ncbi:transcriptional regulator [bacterium]|nr:MAG: transcriptional regulator [bacterium]
MAVRAIHHGDYQPIPDILRNMRENAGLTQRDLADLLRVAQQSIHSSETHSRRIDLGEYCRWAEACGVESHDALDIYLKARPKA